MAVTDEKICDYLKESVEYECLLVKGLPITAA